MSKGVLNWLNKTDSDALLVLNYWTAVCVPEFQLTNVKTSSLSQIFKANFNFMCWQNVHAWKLTICDIQQTHPKQDQYFCSSTGRS